MVQFEKHGCMGREGALESNCMCMCMLSCFSCVLFFVTPGTIACQAPLSMGFSRQELWSGLRALLQVVFPTQGSNPYLYLLSFLHWQGSSLPLAPPGKPGSLTDLGSNPTSAIYC